MPHKEYKYKIWEEHQHDLIPEYESDGKTYRMWVSWPCRLCGQYCDPNLYFFKVMTDKFYGKTNDVN